MDVLRKLLRLVDRGWIQEGELGWGRSLEGRGPLQHSGGSGAGDKQVTRQPLSETQVTDRVCGSDCVEWVAAGRGGDRGSY